jgi:hypothetical protein
MKSTRSNVSSWPVATKIHACLDFGNQGESGPVVLSGSVSHFDPDRTFDRHLPLRDWLTAAVDPTAAL